MATLDQLQAQRNEILKGMSSPAEIHFAERGITNRPQGDHEQALQRIDAEIARAQGTANGSVFQVTTGRGLA